MNPRIEQYIQQLTQHLGYDFNRQDLLPVALTHRSAGNINNERLEFLGDSILNFTVGSELFALYPKADEGALTRMRAALVCEETLAEIASAFGLSAVLQLGPGEAKSGGHQRASILADGLEAIIGAIYLDGGIEAAKRCILKWFGDRLKTVGDQALQKDAKTCLQEFLQGRRLPLPKYEVLEITGKPHAQVFKVSCQIEGSDKPLVGEGPSRRKAEQAAAALALIQLGIS